MARSTEKSGVRPRHVAVLGCTGSIGRQALEVVAGTPGLSVVGLVAGSNATLTLDQARAFGVRAVGFHDATAARRAAGTGGLEVFAGDDGIAELVEAVAAEANAAGAELTVLNGIVGAAGLRATLVALRCGATLALANKESMVAGGNFVLQAARESRARIIPVDSEHSAIFQCLAGGRPSSRSDGRVPEANPLLSAEEILLTGSGGPFRGFSRAQLEHVTADQALRHPNWVMGPKVTIDSATLMNKGLELIEAHFLFGVPYGQIRVVIHPQSTVHSLVRYSDGSVLAHLGVPDMRTPIGYALTYPDRAPLAMVKPLDLAQRELSFAPPDDKEFRCLALARAAGERGSGAAIVLNAANEIAVAAFLDRRLSFLGIADLVERSLERLGDAPVDDVDDVFALDAEARVVSAALLPAQTV